MFKRSVETGQLALGEGRRAKGVGVSEEQGRAERRPQDSPNTIRTKTRAAIDLIKANIKSVGNNAKHQPGPLVVLVVCHGRLIRHILKLLQEDGVLMPVDPTQIHTPPNASTTTMTALFNRESGEIDMAVNRVSDDEYLAQEAQDGGLLANVASFLQG